MTTTQRKPYTREIELAPNQIYLLHASQQEHPIHTAVEGYPDWSAYHWDLVKRIGLFYKGRYVTTLLCHSAGHLVDIKHENPDVSWPCPAPSKYATISEAIEHYRGMPERLAWLDKWNKEDGLETWCIRQSFTPVRLPLNVTIPQQERQRIERLAKFDGRTLEEFALEALYKHLAGVEERYTDHEQWKQQRQRASSIESEVQEVEA